jgi:hypothetical protein
MSTQDPIIGDDRPRQRHAVAPQGLGAANIDPQVAVKVANDSLARAAARAAELREHGALEEGPDDFFIDPAIIPEGWSYEWKRHTTLGAQDPAYEVQIARGGWEAVPVHRHPELMPDNYSGATILRKGQILMERPLVITQEARQRDLRNARNQVRQKEQQLTSAPAGPNSPFAADNKGAPMVKINKSYEPMPIPEK